MEVEKVEIEQDPYEDMSIQDVLSYNYPGSDWSLINDVYEGLHWDDSNTTPKPTLEEIKAHWLIMKDKMIEIKLRKFRHNFLEDTDKYALPDWPHKSEEDRQAWLDYRQSLRDMTTNIQLDEEGEIIWPNRPDGKDPLDPINFLPF